MKRLCFGTLLNLLYQSKASQVTQKTICGAIFEAFGMDANSYDDSVIGHLKSGHDNVPKDLTDRSRIASPSVISERMASNLVSCIRPDKRVPLIRAIKAVLREDTTITENTIVGMEKGYEKSQIVSCSTFTFPELLANLFFYVILYVSNRECKESIKEIEKEYVDSFVDSEEEIFFDTPALQTLIPLKKTVKESRFDRTFSKITESVIVGLDNPSSAHFYTVDINNYEMRFGELRTYITENIAKYVLSRSQATSLEKNGNLDIAGLTAVGQIHKANYSGLTSIDNTLGEILLYIFLEQELGAPKILSKIEIVNQPGRVVSYSDGVHLLSTTRAQTPFHQLVFGASSIEGNLTEAIDRALDKACRIKNNSETELQMVDNTIFGNIYDPDTTKYIESIICPQAPGTYKPDMAFGAYLGYTIKPSRVGVSSPEYREKIFQQMKADIDSLKEYVIEKIKLLGLEGYSFYFYVLPFNDAPTDKMQIIKDALLGGGN